MDLQKNDFNIPNECLKKKIQENNTWGSFVHEHKRAMFLKKIMLSISRRASNSRLFICLIDSEFKEPKKKLNKF
jgi:hypothetical protein